MGDREELVEIGRQAVEELFHAYDPVARRERYLRNRQLKGRPPGNSSEPQAPARSSGPSDAELRESRRRALEARKEELLLRIKQLSAALQQAVAEAKKRSGGDPNPDKPDVKTTDSSKSSAGKKGGGKNSTPDKPLTEAQKREKREASKEQYEKENRTSLNQEVQRLETKAQEIRQELERAIARSRTDRSKKPTTSTASSGR